MMYYRIKGELCIVYYELANEIAFTDCIIRFTYLEFQD